MDALVRNNQQAIGGCAQRALLLEVVDLTFDYGATNVLRGMSFEMRAGQLVALLGSNGAGKTTALRLVSGLQTYSHGRIVFCGEDRRALPPRLRRAFSFIPDEPHLHDLLSPVEFLEFVGALRELEGVDVAARSMELLNEVGLTDQAHRRTGLLSRGMRQRLALAAALLGDPALLVMDEPFTGLDPEAARDIKLLLRRYVAAGMGVLVSTHQLHLAEHLADRVLVTAGGRIVADGTPEELRLEYGRGGTLEDAYISVVGTAQAR